MSREYAKLLHGYIGAYLISGPAAPPPAISSGTGPKLLPGGGFARVVETLTSSGTSIRTSVPAPCHLVISNLLGRKGYSEENDNRKMEEDQVTLLPE